MSKKVRQWASVIILACPFLFIGGFLIWLISQNPVFLLLVGISAAISWAVYTYVKEGLPWKND